MRIHFSSKKECYLRLGGALMGSCGKVEKFIELDQDTELLVEFLPADGNILPLSFVINKQFFENPPECCNVHFYGIGADIIACNFQPRRTDLQVLKQMRVGNLLATFVQQQNMQLLLENNKKFENIPLPFIEEYNIEEVSLGKTSLLLFSYEKDGQKKLYLFNQSCQMLLEHFYTEYTITDTLQLTLQHNDLAHHTLQQTFVLEEEKLVLKEQTLNPQENFSIHTLHAKLLPFDFFQSVLIVGDFSSYLSPNLQDKQELLKEYLGNFIEVQIPKDIFYHHHGEVNAVALVYPKSKSLFEVKFFVVQTENGKICNIQAL